MGNCYVIAGDNIAAEYEKKAKATVRELFRTGTTKEETDAAEARWMAYTTIAQLFRTVRSRKSFENAIALTRSSTITSCKLSLISSPEFIVTHNETLAQAADVAEQVLGVLTRSFGNKRAARTTSTPMR